MQPLYRFIIVLVCCVCSSIISLNAQIGKKKKIVPNEDGICLVTSYRTVYTSVPKRSTIIVDSTMTKYRTISCGSRLRKTSRLEEGVFEVVCLEERTILFYKTIAAALANRGYKPSNHFGTAKARSYLEEHKNIAEGAMWNFIKELNLPYCLFSMEALDSLGLEMHKLDSLQKVYEITEPTRQELLQYKINFDLERLDEEGLQGPIGGKRSLDYFYWIPKDRLSDVVKIDKSYIQVDMPMMKRNLICQDCLIIKGTTRQKNHKEILLCLAELPYIAELRELIHLK